MFGARIEAETAPRKNKPDIPVACMPSARIEPTRGPPRLMCNIAQTVVTDGAKLIGTKTMGAFGASGTFGRAPMIGRGQKAARASLSG
jgi:hypothetical protein